MKTRSFVAGFAVACALALPACPQFESDFKVWSIAADASGGGDASTSDAPNGVGDGSIDASGGNFDGALADAATPESSSKGDAFEDDDSAYPPDSNQGDGYDGSSVAPEAPEASATPDAGVTDTGVALCCSITSGAHCDLGSSLPCSNGGGYLSCSVSTCSFTPPAFDCTGTVGACE
jgi:hypothetical protein